jgi:hypothetical protein
VSTVWFQDWAYSEFVTPSGQKPGVVSTTHTLALASTACTAEMYCFTLAAYSAGPQL